MSPDRSDETNKNAGLARQLLAVILISTSMMNFGMMQGWVSPMAEHFKSADSPVGVLSNTEIGLLAAISPFAILTGSFLFGYIADALGRKIGLFLIGVPCLVGGILLTFPGTKLELFIGRGLTGFSAMSFVIGPMYLSETVHDSIRGMLMSITSIPMYIGLLMTYTFGQHLTYKQFNFIFIALPTIHLCTIIFLPETPYFLVSKSRVKRALRSLTWLRGGNTIVANAELKKIQLPQQDVNISFVQTLKMKDARMALMISTVLISLQTVSGINAIINFASMIFTETGSPLTPDNSAVFSSVLLLISTVVCIFLIDRVGRKPLLYCAFVVGFITSFVICVTLFLRFNGYVINHLDWISLMCLGSFIFTNGVGLGVPPILITNEVAPIEIKSFISVVTLCLSMVMLMSLFQTFPIIYESFGMHWNFVIPAISNLLGVFFTWFYVPETKGKSLREISAYLKGSRFSTSTMNFGMMQGWVSPMTGHFKSADSPVGVLDNTQIGFVAAIAPFAILTGSFLFGYIADAIGRKIGLFLVGVPSLIGGFLLTFAGTKLELYLGRGLTGLSAMSIVMGPMYLSETAHESIRGMLVSIISIPMYTGLLMSYTFGQHLTYKQFNFIFIALPTIHLCSIIFLPETPYFLVSKSRVKSALRSLTWLRGGNTAVANAELKRIQLPRPVEKIGFVQILKMRETRMALLISVVLVSLQTLSGVHVIINFASMIFTETGSPLSPDDSAVFSSVLLLISTVVCIFLIDRLGRKPIIYCAFVVGFISNLVIFAALFMRYNGYVINYLDWISLISLSSFIFFYGVGLGVAPTLITNEVSPVEIKSYVSVVTVILSMVILMSLLQTFPIIYESFGMHWNFVIPAISNLLGIVFTWFYVPETKGKSLSEISAYLKGSKRVSGGIEMSSA